MSILALVYLWGSWYSLEISLHNNLTYNSIKKGKYGIFPKKSKTKGKRREFLHSGGFLCQNTPKIQLSPKFFFGEQSNGSDLSNFGPKIGGYLWWCVVVACSHHNYRNVIHPIVCLQHICEYMQPFICEPPPPRGRGGPTCKMTQGLWLATFFLLSQHWRFLTGRTEGPPGRGGTQVAFCCGFFLCVFFACNFSISSEIILLNFFLFQTIFDPIPNALLIFDIFFEDFFWTTDFFGQQIACFFGSMFQKS